MCHANGLVRSITSQGLRAPTPRPFHGGQGSLRRSLKEPIDQSLEICLSIWTEPCSKGGMLAPPCAIPSTNRPPFGYRERADAQPRPTLSRLDGDQEAFLEAYKNHTVVFGYGIGFVLWYSGYDSMHHLYDAICLIVKLASL